MTRYNKKMAAIVLLLLYMAALLGSAGCRPAEKIASPADKVDLQLVNANTAFGFNLFHALLEEDANENIFISPASVSLALAMTYNGAGGETAAAMEEVLQLKGMSLAEINFAFSELNSILKNPDPKVQLSIANSLWARQGVDFFPEFLQRNRDYFGAEVTALDFDLSEASETINRWVEQQTNNKIKDLIEPPIDTETVMFLINAIYFQADWTKPFNPKKTRDLTFQLSDGSTKQHPIMFREGEFSYLNGEDFQAVSIPYGETGRLRMYVFLPNHDKSLDSFYNELNPGNWKTWLASFQPTEGSLGLPRFKYEYESSLNDVLKTLGMEVAFNRSTADFSAMRPIPPRLFISEVKHKAFIEVNEKGTEAAAATSVEIALESANMDWFSMTVDRPFFFSIVDDNSGSILFMGSVVNPL